MSNLIASVIISMAFTAVLMLFVIFAGRLIDMLNDFLIYRLSNVTGRNIASFIINRVLFIGTVFHELSHALFAKISGAKVIKIRCLVVFSKDTLGYVNFVTQGSAMSQSIQCCLASCAPVLTAFFTVPMFVWLSITYSGNVLYNILFAYCAVSILCHASMSSADLDLYRKGAVCVYPMLTLFVFAVRGLFF